MAQARDDRGAHAERSGGGTGGLGTHGSEVAPPRHGMTRHAAVEAPTLAAGGRRRPSACWARTWCRGWSRRKDERALRAQAGRLLRASWRARRRRAARTWGVRCWAARRWSTARWWWAATAEELLAGLGALARGESVAPAWSRARRDRRRGGRVRVPGSGLAVGGDGGRAAGWLAGVRASAMRECAEALAPIRRLVARGGAAGRAGRAVAGARRRGAAGAVRGDGVAGAAVGRVRGAPRRGGRPLPGRDRRRVRGGRAVAGRTRRGWSRCAAARWRAWPGTAGWCRSRWGPSSCGTRLRRWGRGGCRSRRSTGRARWWSSGDREALEELLAECEAEERAGARGPGDDARRTPRRSRSTRGAAGGAARGSRRARARCRSTRPSRAACSTRRSSTRSTGIATCARPCSSSR